MLDELKNKRDDLQRQIEAIDTVIGIMRDEKPAEKPSKKAACSGPSHPMYRSGSKTVKGVVINRLQEGTGTIRDLSKGLNRNTVRNALWMLRREGMVVKQGKQYQLTETPPAVH